MDKFLEQVEESQDALRLVKIINEMKAYRIKENLFKQKGFLFNRTIYLQVSKAKSGRVHAPTGVPQCSAVSQLLFLICFTYLTDELNYPAFLFVDYVKFVASINREDL